MPSTASQYAANGSSQAEFISAAINDGYSIYCRHTEGKFKDLPEGHDHELVRLFLVYNKKILNLMETALLGRFDYAFNERKQAGHPVRQLILFKNGDPSSITPP